MPLTVRFPIIYILLINIALSLGACSSDSDSLSSQPDPFGERIVQKENFKNTVTYEEFSQSGKNVDNYFNSLSNVKTNFLKKSNKPDVKYLNSYRETCDFLAFEDVNPESNEQSIEISQCTISINEGATQNCKKKETTYLDKDPVVEYSECTSLVADQPTHSTPTSNTQINNGSTKADHYQPNFQDVENCDDAFTNFEAMNNNTKLEFDELFGMLTDSSQLNLSGYNVNSVKANLKKLQQTTNRRLPLNLTPRRIWNGLN